MLLFFDLEAGGDCKSATHLGMEGSVDDIVVDFVISFGDALLILSGIVVLCGM